MLVRLLIKTGPRQDEEFVVKDEILMGRSKGDLLLNDKKASNPHAKIYGDDTGAVFIEDLKSSNGTKLNGEKVKKAQVKQGDVILIGETEIHIDFPSTLDKETEDDVKFDEGSWQHLIYSTLNEISKKTSATSPSEAGAPPFGDVLEFSVTAGPQVGSRFIFGFGPRSFGSHSPDALILEPLEPGILFDILPSHIGLCELRGFTPDLRVNGTPATSVVLQNGDQISAGQTSITVRMNKP